MKRLICLSVLGLTLASVSHASEWLNYVGKGNGATAKVKGKSNGVTYGGSNGISAFSGQLIMKKGDSKTGPWSSPFVTFCITPERDLLGNPAQNPFDISTPQEYVASGDTAYDRIARLVQYGASQTGSANMFDSASSVSDLRASIFQAVLWSLVSTNFAIDIAGANGISGSLLAHNNWMSGSNFYKDIYQEYWNAAINTNLSGRMMVYSPLTGPGATGSSNQQILVGMSLGNDGGTSTPVPEPFTMSLGLAAAGVFVRRRMKKA